MGRHRHRRDRRLQMFAEAIEEARALAEDRATQQIRSVTDLLRSYQRSGVTHIPVGEILRLLGQRPAGQVPEMPGDEARARQMVAEGVDPLTGCRPASAQVKPAGSKPAGFTADGPGGTGLDRVQAAVRKARGGDPPSHVQGFA